MKKLLSILLLASLLILPSCGGKKDGKDSEVDNDVTTTESVPAEETTTAKLTPDLPEKDYEKYEFRILGNSKKFNGHWYCRDLDADEVTGETLNDAIYARNTFVEEKYNVKISAVESSANPYTDAKKSINAGDNAHDLYSISMSVCAAPLAAEGTLIDLNSLPYLGLDQPWWDQKARQMLSVENKLYLTVNDSQIIDKDALFIYLFNKDMIQGTVD